jgi:diaminopimelate dehydrogenase
MGKLQVAVIGLGRMGLVCADALIDASELALAGVVRQPGAPAALPGRQRLYPVASHVRELEGVRAALVCVPAYAVLGVARELLPARIHVAECACFEGPALEAHHAALGEAAENHHVAAVVGAGWDPGILPLLRSTFKMLIPRGSTTLRRHPGLHLHHSAVVAGIRGVKGALTGEYRGDNGASQHYVYVELETGAELAQVQAAIAADPLFAGEVTQVFQVAHLSEMEGEEGLGVVLEHRGHVLPTARTRACCLKPALTPLPLRRVSCLTPRASFPAWAGARTLTPWGSEPHAASRCRAVNARQVQP